MRVTEKAVQVNNLWDAIHWIPKKLVRNKEDLIIGTVQELLIPDWMAREKELI